MAPPAPLECSVEGCGYKTQPGAPTWEACITLLTTHAQSVNGGGGTLQQDLSWRNYPDLCLH